MGVPVFFIGFWGAGRFIIEALGGRAAAWLDTAGFEVPRKADGEPDGEFEISPLLALDGPSFREVMAQTPTITAGQAHCEAVVKVYKA